MAAEYKPMKFRDMLREMDERSPYFPIVVSESAAARRSAVGSYVMLLSARERRAVREAWAWVVFRDPMARHGWRVVVKIGLGYYFRTPPPKLLERLRKMPSPETANMYAAAFKKMLLGKRHEAMNLLKGQMTRGDVQ